MSALLALGRLLWRPYSLWHAVPTAGLMLVIGWLAFLVRGGVREHPAIDTAQILRNAELQLALGAVLIPMAFAAWIGWALYELLLCSFAPLLPALRRRLLAALVLSGIFAAGLTTWWCTENAGAQPVLPFLALAFLSYALGILWSDPGFATWGHARWPLQIVALAPIYFAPEIVRAFERAPLVLGPLAPVLGAGILLLPFRRRIMRARALDLACARLLQPDRASQRVAWRPGRTLAGSADWTRAALHEAFGHARGGWVGALLVNALGWSAALAVVGLATAGLRTHDGGDIASTLYALLGGTQGSGERGKHLLAWALPIWATFALLAPVRPGGVGVCPLSRSRRAEVTWRANVLLAFGVVLPFGLALWGMSEIAFALSGGLAERAHGVPEFAHVLASTLICAPVVFEARLRWLDARKPLRVHDSGLLGLLALVLALPAIALSSLWREGLRRWDVPEWLALIVLLTLASLTLWRKSVAHHFATQDLPV